MTVSADAAEANAALRNVLMAVRVRGRAEVAVVAEAAGLPIDEAQALLAAAAGRGEVRLRDDRCHWALTEKGRVIVTGLNAGAGIDLERLAEHYDQFLTHDAALKRVIAAWQGDRSAARLRAVRDAAVAAVVLIELLATVDRRYASYARRVGRACARLGAGDPGAVAKPGADSVHQVWFELHEDLLVILGRTRSS